MLVSLLAGLLVFLMFVQGANNLIYLIGRDETEQRLIVNATGRKWELTFTTLVTFGGAFFASFPLFYSTSFGGAYWVWMLILLSFVLQAVSYEYQLKDGNIFGKRTYRAFLIFNGFAGPFLLGAAVGTFFTGSAFVVETDAMTLSEGLNASPVISRWANAWHGLDALGNLWNWVCGLAVFFLARILGGLYLLNLLEDQELRVSLRRTVLCDAVPFLITFVAFVGYVLFKDGLTYNEVTGLFTIESYKYLHNLIEVPAVAVLLLAGVFLVLTGLVRTWLYNASINGIWFTGSGTVLAVMALFLLAGVNHTAYYPSSVDMQSSLCLANSSSSEFTLRTMAYVSLIIPFVLAYIIWAWRSLDRGGMSRNDADKGYSEH